MNIGIIGLGVVGQAIYDGLSQLGHNLSFYDTANPNSQLDDVLHTDCIFVCVPTPTVDDNCDVSQVEQTIEKLHHKNYQGIVAIKSTVIPGTTDQLQQQYPNLKLCFVPEFLRAKSALSDFIDHHDVLIVGTLDSQIFDTMVKIHGSLPEHVKMVSPVEAELAKYFSNVYNALRVVFANAMLEVCDHLQADYQQVFDAVTLRKTITKYYLRASKTTRGFGGHCLPKDTAAWAKFVKDLGVDVELFDSIVKDNENFNNRQ
jgi:UDPglucose 6-dehydrogenase